MNKLVIFTLLTTVTSLATANTYHTEVETSFTDRDAGGSAKAKSAIVGATYYFGGVDDSDGPLSEAAFLNRNSNMYIKYGISDEPSTDAFTTYGLGGRYVTETGFILNFDYLGDALTYDSELEKVFDTGSFGLGAYFSDAATLILKISTNQNKNQTTGSEIDSNTFSLNYKQLFTLNDEKSLNLRARLGRTNYEEDRYKDFGSFMIGADYYYNRQLSVGLDLDRFRTQADDKALRYALSSTYFINNTVSVFGSYRITNIDGLDDLDAFELGFQARF